MADMKKPTIQLLIEQTPNWLTAPTDDVVQAVAAKLPEVKEDSIKRKLAKMQKECQVVQMPGPPTVSACMIVKDGAQFLDRCLTSIKPLVSEIILRIDDRTTDNTAEIGEKHGAVISYFTWNDSFSEARNASIEPASGGWILIMDADQELDPRGLNEIRQGVMATNITHMVFQIHHHMPNNGLSVHPSPRMFRRELFKCFGGTIEYIDRVHNQIKPAGDYVMLKAVIHHYGFNLSPEKTAAKHARTERLLLMQIADRPNYMFPYSNLCRNYRQQARYDEVIAIAEQALALPPEHHEPIPHLAIMIDTCWAYLMLKQPALALESAEKALAVDAGNIDALMYAGHACGQIGEPERAIDYYKQYLRQQHIHAEGKQTIPIQLDTVGSTSMAYSNMAHRYEQMGEHRKAFAASFRAAQGDKDNPAMLKPLIGKYVQQTSAMRIGANRPRVLFVQRVPCIRAIKEAQALSKYGIEVGMAYQDGTANDHYGYGDDVFCELIPVKPGGDLPMIGDSIKNAAEGYDIIHVHNEPDMLTVAAIGTLTGSIPIIHDVHDILTERNPGSIAHAWMEKLACSGADGLVVVSPVQHEHLTARYGLSKTPTALIRSAVPKALLPTKHKKKLSADGQIHLVYEGGLRVGGGHRDCRGFFTELASHDINVHIYPNGEAPEYRELANGNKYLHYHDPLPPDKLMKELSQYDAGLIPLVVDDTPGLRFAKNCSLPNKLFEYLACGLPVAARSLQQLTAYIEEHKCGVVFGSVAELVDKMDDLLKISIGADKTVTMEEEIKKLVALYMHILKPKPVKAIGQEDSNDKRNQNPGTIATS